MSQERVFVGDSEMARLGNVLERRLRTLRVLAAGTAGAKTADEACRRFALALAGNPHDLPFALIYLLDEDHRTARLAGLTGVRAALPVSRETVVIGPDAESPNGWPLARVFRSREPLQVHDLPIRFGFLPGVPWPEPPTEAQVLPVVRAGHDRPTGFLVAGINPHRSFDSDYAGFFELVVRQIAAALADARAVDDERRRAVALIEIDRARVAALISLATARKAAAGQRGHLYELFMLAPVAICVLRGPDLVFEIANPHYHAIVNREDLVGLPLLEALPEMNGHGFDRLLINVMATGIPYIAREVPAKLDRLGDGRLDESYFTFTYAPLRDNVGGVNRLMVFAIEVTDQVRMRQEIEAAREAAEAANRSKDEYLAVLGHELRNPLSTIQNALTALKHPAAEPADVEGLQSLIAHQVSHLSHLVDELLDLFRVNAEKIKLARRPMNLADAVTRSVAALDRIGRLAMHRVATQVEAVAIDGDPMRIEQMLGNLLDNALKYTPVGGVIEISCGREDTAAVLRVRDSGIGIAAEDLLRLFEPFVQLDQALELAQGGLGLGLALVSRLAGLHGGTVEAVSEGPGRGSEFVMRIPALITATPAAETVSGQTASRSCRVLVIDDDPDVRYTFGVLLKLLGHRVEEAASGPEGLERLLALRPDVTLIDVGLPGLNGYALARAARQSAGGEGLFLVALTGYGSPQDRQRALDAGFDVHVAKPVTESALREVMALSPSGC